MCGCYCHTSCQQDYRGKLLFIYINAEAPQNLRILEFFDLKADDTPAMRIINVTEAMAKFLPDRSPPPLRAPQTSSPARFSSPTVRQQALTPNTQPPNHLANFATSSPEINAANIKAFAGGYLAGTLGVHLKTQETPEDWDAKPVKVSATSHGGSHAKVAIRSVVV